MSTQDLENRFEKGLPPIILIHGEEPLFIEESSDQIRRIAQQQGFDERLPLVVEPGFDWNRLHTSVSTLSLFATRRLIDLRLPTGRPGEAGTRVLVEYSKSIPQDTVLMIVCGKLDSKIKQAKWYKTIDRAAVVIEHRTISVDQLPGWINARARAKGLVLDPDVVPWLVHNLEGNLLAAAQEIDKLALLSPEGKVDQALVEKSTADNARFNVYTFVDACLSGDTCRALRSLAGLKSEGAEPVLLVWALAREVRTLYRLAAGISAGGSKQQLFKAFRVWAKRVPLVNAALARIGENTWTPLLQQMGRLDRVLKGRESGNIWVELEHVCLTLCRVPVFPNGVKMARPTGY